MVLKESFQYSNFLTKLEGRVLLVLYNKSFILKKIQNHQISKVNSEGEDETLEAPKDIDLGYTPNQLIELIVAIFEEKEALSRAITKAKIQNDFDIDSSISLNKQRQELTRLFDYLSAIKPSEVITTGYAKKFNGEGNQITYSYNIKEVSTINFDRNKTRKLAKDYRKKSDQTSFELDKIQVTLEIEHKPKFEIIDNLDIILDSYFSTN